MLDVIETRDRVTQRGLSGELGIALGLTNLYLKRCINKGLIKVRKAPARRRQQVAGVRVIRDLAALDGAGPGSGAPEAVVITDMKDPQATYERMVALLGQDRVLFPSLLRLSPPRMAGLAAAQ